MYLSLIIPIYNASQYLDNCIRSCICSSLDDYEIILVDDGSTDDSLLRCKTYTNDSHIKLIQQENGGVSIARNTGLQNAKGDWICFVDADDVLTKDFFNVKMSLENDLYCFNWLYTDGTTEKEHLDDGVYKDVALYSFLSVHLVDFIFRTPWAKCFKRSIIEANNIRFDERFRLGEDHLFVLDYLSHCKSICTLDVMVYNYMRPSQYKYSLSMQQVHQYIGTFYSKYKRLNVECIPLLSLLEHYYFLRLQKDAFVDRVKWESNLVVRSIQNKCLHSYRKVDVIKIFLRRPFAILLNNIYNK